MALQKDRMARGRPYLAGDPELLLERKQCRLLCERFNATSFGETATRRAILRELLGEIGDDAEIMAPFQCDYGRYVTVGARSFINYGAVVLDAEDRRRGIETAAPVTIGDGAWLAAGVIVCPGVSIGANAVVGAGSVVTRDMPTGHLCFGNPCRAIREI